RAGAARPYRCDPRARRRARHRRGGGARTEPLKDTMKKKDKSLERWSPWVLLVAVVVLWQLICTGFQVSEFIFPSPWRIWTQFWEFKGIIAGHAWRTFWVT